MKLFKVKWMPLRYIGYISGIALTSWAAYRLGANVFLRNLRDDALFEFPSMTSQDWMAIRNAAMSEASSVGEDSAIATIWTLILAATISELTLLFERRRKRVE
jgi:hypothetical protein